MDWAIDSVRRDTPGIEGVVNLNNAGSALPPQVVVDTVVAHRAAGRRGSRVMRRRGSPGRVGTTLPMY